MHKTDVFPKTAPFNHLPYRASRSLFKGAVNARQPCRRVPQCAEFRPVALRPTLTSGLPLTSLFFGLPVNVLVGSRYFCI
jgi:hypothetical protein